MYGKIGKEIEEILSTIRKNHRNRTNKRWVCPNHVHLYVAISLKMSDVETERKECAYDIRPSSGIQGQIRQVFLGKRILCGDNRVGE